jgi:hypothetical protein
MNVVTVEQGADMTQRIPESFSIVTNNLPPRGPNDNDDDEDEDGDSHQENPTEMNKAERPVTAF